MSRILVIDDDVHIGNMLEELLARDGYQVSRAYSGTEALLALTAAKPDLVLLDLMLPGLSAWTPPSRRRSKIVLSFSFLIWYNESTVGYLQQTGKAGKL